VARLGAGRLLLGLITALLACVLLFVCTAMIYASVRFLQEWASPLHAGQLPVLGLASGCTLAAALAALLARRLGRPSSGRLAVASPRGAGHAGCRWRRNARLKPKSTLQYRHRHPPPVIRQRRHGLHGGSFNTREFFHGQSAGTLRHGVRCVLVGAFVLPLVLLRVALGAGRGRLACCWRSCVQFAGPAGRALVLLRAGQSPAEPLLPGGVLMARTALGAGWAGAAR
jgi:hypothetical protein